MSLRGCPQRLEVDRAPGRRSRSRTGCRAADGSRHLLADVLVGLGQPPARHPLRELLGLRRGSSWSASAKNQALSSIAIQVSRRAAARRSRRRRRDRSTGRRARPGRPAPRRAGRRTSPRRHRRRHRRYHPPGSAMSADDHGVRRRGHRSRTAAWRAMNEPARRTASVNWPSANSCTERVHHPRRPGRVLPRGSPKCGSHFTQSHSPTSSVDHDQLQVVGPVREGQLADDRPHQRPAPGSRSPIEPVPRLDQQRDHLRQCCRRRSGSARTPAAPCRSPAPARCRWACLCSVNVTAPPSTGTVMPTPTRATPKQGSLPSGLRSHIRGPPTAAASVSTGG